MKRLALLSQVDARILPILVGLVLISAMGGLSRTFHLGMSSSFCLIIVLGLLGGLLWVALGAKRRTPFENESHLHLGRYLTGPFAGRPFLLPLPPIRHTLITAITGFGKSTLIRRQIDEILRCGLRFLYIDFKGERGDHEEILKICERHGVRDKVQVFDLSSPDACLPCNLLTLFEDVEETVNFVVSIFYTPESNEYYRNEAERFLRCSLHLMDKAKWKRSFVRLLEIYNNENSRNALIARAERNAGRGEFFIEYFRSEFNQLSARERSERFSGFVSYLSPFCADPLKRVFNPEDGPQFTLNRIFSDNIPALVRVPGEAMGDLSVRIVQAIIKILSVVIARRREERDRKDYFLLLDEGCSYVSESLSDLCKKAGSAQVKIVLTRMSDSDFEAVSPALVGQLISSFGVFICGHTTDPKTRDSMAQLSLTTEDVKLTRQVATGSETGQGTIRDVHRFNVHPSEFGRLKRGEFWVISTILDLCEKVLIEPAGGVQ